MFASDRPLSILCLNLSFRLAIAYVRWGVLHPTLQRHLPVVGALYSSRTRGDVRAVDHLPAEADQPVKGILLIFSFSNSSHVVQSTTPTIAKITIIVRTK